jgi:hypothetical protein
MAPKRSGTRRRACARTARGAPHPPYQGTEHWQQAHAKGVLLLGPHGGAWLQHSVPRYPGRPPRPTSDAPLSSPAGGGPEGPWDEVRPGQRVFGQHALCMALSVDSVNALAAALAVAGPHVYDWALPQPLAEAYPPVAALLTGADTAAGAEGPQGSAAAQAGRRPGPAPPAAATATALLASPGGRCEWLYAAKSGRLNASFHEEVRDRAGVEVGRGRRGRLRGTDGLAWGKEGQVAWAARLGCATRTRFIACFPKRGASEACHPAPPPGPLSARPPGAGAAAGLRRRGVADVASGPIAAVRLPARRARRLAQRAPRGAGRPRPPACP